MRKWAILGLIVAGLFFGCEDLARELAKALPDAKSAATRTETPPPVPVDVSSSELIHVFFSKVDGSVSANRANPASIARVAAAYIDRATVSIDMAMHELDNVILTDALVRAHRRGVRIRLVTETDYIDELGPHSLSVAGAPVISDHRSALMHNKFMILDNEAVWTGSFNFTENCAYKNDNNGILIRDPKVVASFAEKFRWFFELRKFGGRPTTNSRIPYPSVTLSDGTPVEIYFSTHDQVDRRVIETIQRARRSIKFMAFSFTHQQIADAMIERAQNGVEVLGVVETRQVSQYSMHERLNAQRNISVLLDGNPFNMHHKVIIIDDEVVITGSYNFSTNASRSNDENIVIVHSRNVAAQFDTEFARVRSKAQAILADQGTTRRR